MKLFNIVRFAIIFSIVFVNIYQVKANDPFYDISTIQKIEIFINRSDWDYALDSLKTIDGGYLKADSVKVNDTKFSTVGVKYKGNSSFNANNLKNSWNISLDEYESQNYQGFKTIKLANCYQDPSMIREVLSYSILGNYMHAPQANFAKVYVNGNYHGLYSNTESVNKTFVSNHFNSSSNTFIECSPIILPSPANKSSLRYISADSTAYSNLYEIKSTYGWNELVAFTNIVSNQSANLPNAMDMDKLAWMLAYNNVLVNLDSYSGVFSQNYLIYKDNAGRFNPIMWDLNMSFGGFPYAGSGAVGMGTLTISTSQTLSPTLHETDVYWPLIKAVMGNATYRKLYFAHMRTIVADFFETNVYETKAKELQALIDDAVLTDNNKFFSYAQFKDGLTADVVVGSYTVPGITNLMNGRLTYLKTNAEYSYSAPVISQVNPGTTSPILNDSVVFTAIVQNATSAYLRLKSQDAILFEEFELFDDGKHYDSNAGDGIFGIKIKISSINSQYYVYAANSLAASVLPARAEFEFYSLTATNLTLPKKGDLVINEFVASNTEGVKNPSGLYADWIELYNNTSSALSLNGLYITDNYTKPTKSTFPDNTIIQPKSFLTIWADEETAVGNEIHAAIKLSASGEQLMISDGLGYVLDSLTFGSQISNISMGRCPDGTGSFKALEPSFGKANTCTNNLNNQISSPLKLYPNPVNNELRIEGCEENAVVLIYNIVGTLICKIDFTSEYFTQNVSDWANGVYILKQNSNIVKFIIQH